MEHETHHVSHTKQNQQTWILSGSIVFAAVIVAASVLYAGSIFKPIGTTDVTDTGSPAAVDTSEIFSIHKDDYVWGNPDAPVKLYEFSDLECPFCKRFHDTLTQVMDTYGKDGTVAVVYRHFPLDTLHPKARNEAEAAECAGQLGGNTGFWNFVNGVFAITPSNNGLDPNELPKIAGQIGLNVDDFNACLKKQPFADKIKRQQEEGVNVGVQGTPYTAAVNKQGKVFPINGAQDMATVKATIDAALKE